MEKEIKVICYGNVLSSDDGMGSVIAKELSNIKLQIMSRWLTQGLLEWSLLSLLLKCPWRKMIDRALWFDPVTF